MKDDNPSDAHAPGAQRHSKTMICVVDDDADLLAALRFSLQVHGYAVRTYPSAEALLSDDSDLIGGSCFIVDQNLPGLNGLELMKTLRRRGLDGPALLITTYPNAPVREAAARLGLRIVEKPLLGDALMQAVREQTNPDII